MGGPALRRGYFTGEEFDERVFLFNARRANRINDEDGFYAHTHMAYDNDAFLRVYTYQHVAERNYPGRIQKVCFCDWRKLAGVAEQTDCTLTAEANNGCTFEDGDNPECKDNYEETRDGEDEDDDEDDDDEDDGEEEQISVCRIALYRVAHRGEKGLPYSCM